MDDGLRQNVLLALLTLALNLYLLQESFHFTDVNITNFLEGIIPIHEYTKVKEKRCRHIIIVV